MMNFFKKVDDPKRKREEEADRVHSSTMATNGAVSTPIFLPPKKAASGTEGSNVNGSNPATANVILSNAWRHHQKHGKCVR